jgi:transcriptional regulator GlxA family with amidase domain
MNMVQSFKTHAMRTEVNSKYWTVAGVSAGIDLSFAIVNEIAGEQYTKATMLDMVFDPQPPFKGILSFLVNV